MITTWPRVCPITLNNCRLSYNNSILKLTIEASDKIIPALHQKLGSPQQLYNGKRNDSTESCSKLTTMMVCNLYIVQVLVLVKMMVLELVVGHLGLLMKLRVALNTNNINAQFSDVLVSTPLFEQFVFLRAWLILLQKLIIVMYTLHSYRQ